MEMMIVIEGFTFRLRTSVSDLPQFNDLITQHYLESQRGNQFCRPSALHKHIIKAKYFIKSNSPTVPKLRFSATEHRNVRAEYHGIPLRNLRVKKFTDQESLQRIFRTRLYQFHFLETLAIRTYLQEKEFVVLKS